jgi:acyl carrier protein
MSQLDEILDIVANVSMVERSKLIPDAKISDLGITSLDMVEIICELEDKFDIELPYNANMNFQKFPTFGDVLNMIQENIAKAGKG